MQDCKENDIKKLKEMGLDGLYKLILTQQEQIDRLYGAVNMLIESDRREAQKILYGEGGNFEV